MRKNFSCVSIIIPVFNAVQFIEEAVKSVVNFEEVGEVILIEDGGNDGSYEKCKSLELEFEKVQVLVHTDRQNIGASASRNLGILHAKYPFIAFLDADDYFLANRFDCFRNFLERGVEFDGIYEPIQYFNGSNKIYGIKKFIDPKKLTYYLIRGTYGHFHTNGLIVKKELLINAGLFVEALNMHEDSDLWIKISYYGKLIAGNSLNEPVAMVRRHDGNRIWKGTTNKSRYKQLYVTWHWAKNENIGIINRFLLLRKLMMYRLKLIFDSE